MKDLIPLIVGLGLLTVLLLLTLSQVRYNQGLAEGQNNGYRQALKEFRVGNIE